MTSDKILSLENIRQQFQQDLIMVFNNHVFRADPVTMLMLDKYKDPIDKDGFPVPLRGEELLHLTIKLGEAWNLARKKYFERMSALGIDKLTEVKSDTEEPTE